MKRLIVIYGLVVFLVGCGLAEQQMCGPLDMAVGCNAFFGDKDSEQDERLGALEVSQRNMQAHINTLNDLLASKVDGPWVQDTINAALLGLVINYTTINNITNNNYYQGSIFDLIDPCPNVASNNPKEMIVKITNNGSVEYFAYFQHGNNRHLTQLFTGVAYQTTDARSCAFTLN